MAYLILLFCFLANSLFAQHTHISSFTPTSGTRGTRVLIHGSAFTGTTFVGFGGLPAQNFIVLGDTLISARVGNGASGYVLVSGPKGVDSLAGFIYVRPTDTPHISGFSPDSGSAGTVVTISGKHFTGTTAVRFGSTAAASFTIASDSSIRATVGFGSSGSITVTTPVGSTSAAGFTYIPAAGPTHISHFTPTSAATGATVDIFGSSFTGTSFVSFGGVSARSFTVAADTLILAVVGSGASGSVVVSGSNGTDSLAGFTYIPPVADTPHILSFTPDSARARSVVSINGKHFTGVTSVRFGGTPAASFTVVSDSIIHATVGNGATGFVAVANPNGSDSVAGFVFIPSAAPTHISRFAPVRGTTGTTVDIFGSSFTGTTFVSFGGVSAQSFTVAADTLILAVVGSGASGSVVVSGSNGTDSLAGFTYIPPVTDTPHILSFTPDTARTGTVVTISGTGFTGATSVSFGGTPAASFTVVSDSTIDATVGNGATGFVAVANPTGSDSVAGFVFVDSTSDSTSALPVGASLMLKSYPNPAVGSLFVLVPHTTTRSKLILSAISGKVVRTVFVQPNATTVRIGLNGLIKGVYKLLWSDGVHTAHQTVLVMNE
ncbi:hypothetical protein GCM10011511_56130 [Puia dinghuensis]|uniref:IPT/TIG domain-containing protein n=2 Tax=Puia dinghuensis TaxID=1792502 RepID=A0A8J2XWN7_9BACT|nr:hypothetical protein GCM10011511_56130 [Puia dinghuensis]